jgi:CRP-like cAMP-binding protein
MLGPLARKLNSFVDLSDEDIRGLDRMGANARSYKAGEVLIEAGDRPEHVFLLLEGWACRYKVTPEGDRQIMAYLIPGDLCDIHIFILKTMDHGISLLSDAKVAAIPAQKMLALLRERPAVAQALLWATLVDEAVLREWVVNLGQRDALERIAHLFCEMWLRMEQVGLVDGPAFSLPLTQTELAETLGLTAVHVNRVIQKMREDGLISLYRKHLTILDAERLKAIAGFDPNYLHLDRRT